MIRLFVPFFVLSVLPAFAMNPLSIHPKDGEEAAALFQHPSAVFSSGPLWVWNDRMTEEQIARDLDEMADKHVMQVFVHPRPGLMTPYLSEEWFDRWGYALQEAKKRNMLIWIYDENSYPSGFAGGFVPEEMPESRGKGLVLKQVNTLDLSNLPDPLVAVFQWDKQANNYVNITQKMASMKSSPKGDFLVFYIALSPHSSWFAGRTYVDLIKPGVTEKFLQITLDPYKKHFGDEFGKTLLGSFTDEPHLTPGRNSREFHWSDGLAERFEKRWDYSILDHLPSLFLEVGDWKRVRHNFQSLLLDEFISHWGKKYSEYCAKNNLAMTGHYWEHGWPDMQHNPDNMAMYQWQQVPGIDCLFNQYNEGVHGQFGNVRSVKELASVANQMGRHRRLCEIYGGGGWDIRFEDLKRIADWNGVLGVTLFNQHLAHTTLRGARKHDYPQSFTYHAPWWKSYRYQGDYLARLALAMSSGEEINPILLIEPSTTAWMYYTRPGSNPRLQELGDRFQKLVVELSQNQVEYDLGSEDLIRRHGKVTRDGFQVGKRTYSCVILPQDMENIQEKTMQLLSRFDGPILSLRKEVPTRVDGNLQDIDARLKNKIQYVSPDALLQSLRELVPSSLQIQKQGEEQGILYHQRRVLEDGELVLFVNSSIEKDCRYQITHRVRSVEKWNLETGEREAFPFTRQGDKMQCNLHVPPAGSLLLLFSNKAKEPFTRTVRVETVKPVGRTVIRRNEPNVLTLDYCTVTVQGETRKDILFYNAQKFIFQKHGLKENPWDHAIQFKDEFITKTFPADSGFQADFRFQVGDKVPGDIKAVVERPDLYNIEINGHPVSAIAGAWYLDRAFGQLDIQPYVKPGENHLTLKAQPMTVWHELERVFLIGSFSVDPAQAGFVLAPDRSLQLGSWKTQGHPFYAGSVWYEETFDVKSLDETYKVYLPKWYGSVANVKVNGSHAGIIGYQPWECDVTEYLKTGRNRIEVEVIGTPKNLLGPHHNNPPLGIASPWSFRNGPEPGPPAGEAYSQLDYGLFEPYVLRKYTIRDR